MSKSSDSGGSDTKPRSNAAATSRRRGDRGTGTPALKTAEGVAKLLLGFAAGVLLLYAILESWQTGQRIPDRLIYLLGTFIFAFLGVDIWAILRRARGDDPGR